MKIGMDLRTALKGSLAILFLSSLGNKLQAQTVLTALPDSVIEQRLVDLAMQAPEVKRIEHQNKINEYQLKTARSSWMNFLTISANYNEQTFSKTAQQQNIVFPKYFFGVNLPLGTIISSKQGKIAKENIAMTQLDQEAARRRAKTDVISAWKQYKAQAEIISIESAYLNDLQVALTQADEKFKKNGITFEQYNTALKSRNDQQAKLISLKMELDLKKLQIEQMIGTTLESVLK